MLSNSPTISILLTQQAHDLAKTFASEQKDFQKARQVYQNTLAVFAVDTFLSKWMQMETALEESDSWDFLIRYYRNVADLAIPDLGKVECELISSECFPIFNLTQEVLAYVPIQLDESLSRAYLLGFVPSVDLIYLEQPISSTHLQPIINLPNYIIFLEDGKNLLESQNPTAIQFKTFLQTHSLTTILTVAFLEYFLRHESKLNFEQYLRDFLLNSNPSFLLQSSKSALSDIDEENAKRFLKQLSNLWNLQASINPAFKTPSPTTFLNSELLQAQQQITELLQSVFTGADTIKFEIEYLGNWLQGQFGGEQVVNMVAF